jgi:hypothetical protein
MLLKVLTPRHRGRPLIHTIEASTFSRRHTWRKTERFLGCLCCFASLLVGNCFRVAASTGRLFFAFWLHCQYTRAPEWRQPVQRRVSQRLVMDSMEGTIIVLCGVIARLENERTEAVVAQAETVGPDVQGRSNKACPGLSSLRRLLYCAESIVLVGLDFVGISLSHYITRTMSLCHWEWGGKGRSCL